MFEIINIIRNIKRKIKITKVDHEIMNQLKVLIIWFKVWLGHIDLVVSSGSG